jgi:enamine deaminase RidA (YjgF/YER057c/UK114 family)
MTTRHHLLNPEGMIEPVGFSHGALAADGRTLYIAGQTGARPGLPMDPDLADQFGVACAALARVIEEAGGTPGDLVSLTIYTTDIERYQRELALIGAAYREVFGKHFPPAALIGVAALFEPGAMVELVGVAVVPSFT